MLAILFEFRSEVLAQMKAIFEQLQSIQRNQGKIMSDLDTLNASQAKGAADFATFVSDVGVKLKALQDALTAAQNAAPTIDLSAPISAANALDAAVLAADAALNPTLAPAAA